MQIPEQVTLINTEVKIKLDPNLVKRENKVGWADYQRNEIVIDDSDAYKINKEHTFYHELVHWILYKMGNELEQDEQFVDLFACILHQALATKSS